MAKKTKILYKTITTQQGEIDNKCPACSGECVEIFDYTHARGGDIKVRLCSLCNGNGKAIEGIDYKYVVNYDEEGNKHTYLETIKENRYDSNR